ncbi:MAG: hypothetical protein J0H22_10660, partial [Actinobacteria bacterium]|nr:hypothetical protein [Actinomycetota bacterium]
ALSFHPYQYRVPFGTGTPYGPMAPVNQLATIHQEMVAAGDGSKQIWATEYGEPTSVVDEATQASFISNFMNSWSSFNYTGPMFIYTTRDRNSGSTSDQDTLGVFRTDWTPKPAANVIAQWTATHPQTPVDPPAPTAVPVTAVTTLNATTKTLAAQTLSTASTATAMPATATTPATRATPATPATPVTAAAPPKALAPKTSATDTDTAAPAASTKVKPPKQDSRATSAPTNSGPKNTGPRSAGPRGPGSNNK